MFIEPDAPWQNPFAETLHIRLRDELLNHELLTTVLEANVMLKEWMWTVNERRAQEPGNTPQPTWTS